MLKSVHLQNFRGFRDHQLPLRQETIIVGANNAGKSTTIEALRLISLVANRYKNLSYSQPPRELGLPFRVRAVSPSLEDFNINFDNLYYLLVGDPPAVITAHFAGGKITIYLLATKKLYAVIAGPTGEVVASKGEATRVDLNQVHILPQVAPLERDERILTRDYVRAHISSERAPLHFRNQLRLMPKAYAAFTRLVTDTWPGLRIRELVNEAGMLDEPLGLLVEDGDFCAEAAWMGHGVQVWLQIMWFLARTPQDACVVLDEPDVYLHPDLQRRLIKLVRSRYPQVVVATHSIEIMSETDPRDILVIDRSQNESRFADAHPAVQRLVDHIGSSQNINLARLHAAKKFLLVEGEDLNLLSHFHALLFPNSPNSLGSLPNLPVGGWGGWGYGIGSKMALENYVGGKVITYCILDSDYHTLKQISERYEQAQRHGIQLHVWSRKEIENYLLVPDAICRIIKSRAKGDRRLPTPSEISGQIDLVAEGLRQTVVENFGNEFLNEDRKASVGSVMGKAQALVDGAWQKRETRWGLVSGKDVLSHLSEWSQDSFDVSFGPMAVLRELRGHEIPIEITEVISAIEDGAPLASIRQRNLQS